MPRWGKRPIASITQRDVIELLDLIVDRGPPVLANRVLAIVRKLFNWCCERGTLQTSPCDRVKAPAPELKRDRVLTDAELALIWNGAGSLGYPFGPFTQLLILIGQRREEVAGMRWSELDSDMTMWTLPAARAKNNVQHQVPIVPWVRAILGSLPRIEGSDYILTTTGRNSISGYSKAKAALDKAATALNGHTPIPPWVVHDVRRTVATRMAKLGVALPTVEEVPQSHLRKFRRCRRDLSTARFRRTRSGRRWRSGGAMCSRSPGLLNPATSPRLRYRRRSGVDRNPPGPRPSSLLGSFDDLWPHLCAGSILARHKGLTLGLEANW